MTTNPTAEHIAHQLWPMRPQFRFLQTREFNTEMSLLNSVKHDIITKMFSTFNGAVAFYKDLNQHGVE